MAEELPLSLFTRWLASGERGVSSEAIVSHLTGEPVGRYRIGDDYPFDPSDFRRCEVLLRHVPLARLTFPAMASRSPIWAALVAEWDELVALMESESPGVFGTSDPRGSAPKTYARMKEIRGVSA